MKAPSLETTNSAIQLIAPDIERDAPLSVTWLNGELGRATMLLMGNSESEVNEILPTTLEAEKERVQESLTDEKELNWMIAHEHSVVGSIWVALTSSDELPSPSMHIMIGDPAMRGKGIGATATAAVLQYLRQQGYECIYSRYMLSNEGSKTLLQYEGFENFGAPYKSKVGLEFQNVLHRFN